MTSTTTDRTYKFLNIHVLYTLAGANPNRDDTGTPKSLRYGGVDRSRMSSQSMTRAKRVGYEHDPQGEKSYRSAQMPTEIVNRISQLLGRDLTEQERQSALKEATLEVNKLVMEESKAKKKADTVGGKPTTSGKRRTPKSKQPDDRNTPTTDDEVPDTDTAEGDNESEAGNTAVWLAETEINSLAAAIVSKHHLAQTTDPDTDEGIKAGKTQSLSIAAFGRMFAQRPDLQIEAAMQRSSAFTTHPASIDLDYFTAVDELSDRGAAHLNLRQDTGGVYYWHANIDRDQLGQTWDLRATETTQRLTTMFCHILDRLPTGGQNHSAHQGLPALVLITEADAPVSLQAAFESPVRPADGGGYLAPSIQALLSEHRMVGEYAPNMFGATIATGTRAPHLPAQTNQTNEPGARETEGKKQIVVDVRNRDQAAQAMAAWVLTGNLPAGDPS